MRTVRVSNLPSCIIFNPLGIEAMKEAIMKLICLVGKKKEGIFSF